MIKVLAVLGFVAPCVFNILLPVILTFDTALSIVVYVIWCIISGALYGKYVLGNVFV